MVLVNGLFLHLHYHFITIFFPVPTSAAAFATYVPLDDSEAKGFFFFQLCYPADHVLPSSLSNKLLRLHLSTVLRATVSFPRPNDKNWWNFHDISMNTNQKFSMFTEINVVVRNCFIGWENNYKLTFWSDKRYNSLALIGQELLSCISCPMRIQVCKYRTTLPQLESKLAIFNQLCFNLRRKPAKGVSVRASASSDWSTEELKTAGTMHHLLLLKMRNLFGQLRNLRPPKSLQLQMILSLSRKAVTLRLRHHPSHARKSFWPVVGSWRSLQKGWERQMRRSLVSQFFCQIF